MYTCIYTYIYTHIGKHIPYIHAEGTNTHIQSGIHTHMHTNRHD